MKSSGYGGDGTRRAFADAGSSGHTHNTAPTRSVEVDGVRFAYRRFGNPLGAPIVLLQHFMATSTTTTRRSLTHFAIGSEVILTDNAGVGLSTGAAPEDRRGRRLPRISASKLHQRQEHAPRCARLLLLRQALTRGARDPSAAPAWKVASRRTDFRN
jgi:pimeloyl-ACP methyl ester carboxylesterase